MKKVIVFVLMALTFWACEEVISVPDISDDEIEILAPLDGVVVDVPEVAFSWEEIEFADQYEVQIATPSFFCGQSNSSGHNPKRFESGIEEV